MEDTDITGQIIMSPPGFTATGGLNTTWRRIAAANIMKAGILNVSIMKVNIVNDFTGPSLFPALYRLSRRILVLIDHGRGEFSPGSHSGKHKHIPI